MKNRKLFDTILSNLPWNLDESNGRPKNYDGYKAWNYLELDKDYTVFKLPKEIGRVESYKVPISQQEEEHVEKLFEASIVILMYEYRVSDVFLGSLWF